MDNTQQKQETRKVKPTQQVEVQSKRNDNDIILYCRLYCGLLLSMFLCI